MAEIKQRSSLLPAVFWSVFFGSALVVLVPTLEETAHPRGQFSGLAVAIGLFLAVGLAAVAIVVALIRKPVAYSIGLVLVCAPLVWWAASSLNDQSQRWVAPSLSDQDAGRGYFPRQPDRALAEAIIAKDVARVSELAPAADLDAVGWGNMNFMRLAMERTRADPKIIGALLRAGLDPDQDSSALYRHISNDKDEPLLHCVIDAGVDLNKHMGRGQWFLFARYDWPEGLALMLDHGVDTEARDALGYTMIMRAAQAGSWPTVGALLEHGSRKDRMGNDGQSLRDLLSRAIAQSKEAIPPGIVALQGES